MKFFVDHDVAAAVADALRRHGHDVITLREVLAPDAADPLVFSTAQEKGCVMVTCNRNDFLKLAAQLQHHGLIILLRRRTARNECINLLRLLEQAGPAGLAGNINFA